MEKNEVYNVQNKLVFRNPIVNIESVLNICSSEEYIDSTIISVKGDTSNILEFKWIGSDIAMTKLITCFQKNWFKISSYVETEINWILYYKTFEPNKPVTTLFL